jgi:hypothetical protein
MRLLPEDTSRGPTGIMRVPRLEFTSVDWDFSHSEVLWNAFKADLAFALRVRPEWIFRH